MENEMSLREETRWHKCLSWLIVFEKAESLIVSWRQLCAQKTARGAADYIWELSVFELPEAIHLFLIVSFHMIDGPYIKKQKLQCILSRGKTSKLNVPKIAWNELLQSNVIQTLENNSKLNGWYCTFPLKWCL